MDYIYPPYRNTATLSSIYVKRIEIDNYRDLETWGRGAPEFYLSIYKANSSGEAIRVRNEMEFAFNDKKNAQNFSGKEVYQWLYNSDYKWYDNLTLSLMEGDGESIKLKLGVSIPIKLAEIISIEPSASVEFTIKNGGQNCGETSLFYFDNPNRVLNFPNYGAKITISETN